MRKKIQGSWQVLVGKTGLSLSLILALSSIAIRAHAVEYRLRIPEISPEPIPCDGFSHALTNTIGLPPGHGHVTVLKAMDKSTPLLFERLCAGQSLPEVRIDVRSPGIDLIRYYSIRLRDVLVSSFQASGQGGEPKPVESISFNYAKIEWTYIRTDKAGAAEYAGSTYWDQAASGGGVSDPDSDGDGIPDRYEAAHRLKALENDADEDLDDDGLTNREEFHAGTSASDSNSVFKVAGVSTPTLVGFNVRVEFDSIPGRTYHLYAMSEVGGARTRVHTVTASSGSTVVELDLPGDLAFVVVTVPVDGNL